MIDELFTEARTHFAWLPKPVDDDLLRKIYEVARMAPTGGNAQPLRIVFVKSQAAKERLKPALAPMNVEKSMTAPVTAILALDTTYWEKLPQLFPARPENKDRIAAMPPEESNHLGELNAFMQCGYVLLAARALGLDCGPMGGFDRAKVNAEFFPDGAWRSLLLMNLGHGDPSKMFPRNPRLSFDEACRIE